MKIIGWDKFGGSPRVLMAVVDGPLVEIIVEGSEGNGRVMLTPDQAMAMIQPLARVASEAAETTGLEESDAVG